MQRMMPDSRLSCMEECCWHVNIEAAAYQASVVPMKNGSGIIKVIEHRRIEPSAAPPNAALQLTWQPVTPFAKMKSKGSAGLPCS